jgi:hypothetical protein
MPRGRTTAGSCPINESSCNLIPAKFYVLERLAQASVSTLAQDAPKRHAPRYVSKHLLIEERTLYSKFEISRVFTGLGFLGSGHRHETLGMNSWLLTCSTPALPPQLKIKQRLITTQPSRHDRLLPCHVPAVYHMVHAPARRLDGTPNRRSPHLPLLQRCLPL